MTSFEELKKSYIKDIENAKDITELRAVIERIYFAQKCADTIMKILKEAVDRG